MHDCTTCPYVDLKRVQSECSLFISTHVLSNSIVKGSIPQCSLITHPSHSLLQVQLTPHQGEPFVPISVYEVGAVAGGGSVPIWGT